MATFLFYAFSAKEVFLSDLRRNGISEEANLTDKCGKSHVGVLVNQSLTYSVFFNFCLPLFDCPIGSSPDMSKRMLLFSECYSLANFENQPIPKTSRRCFCQTCRSLGRKLTLNTKLLYTQRVEISWLMKTFSSTTLFFYTVNCH